MIKIGDDKTPPAPYLHVQMITRYSLRQITQQIYTPTIRYKN